MTERYRLIEVVQLDSNTSLELQEAGKKFNLFLQKGGFTAQEAQEYTNHELLHAKADPLGKGTMNAIICYDDQGDQIGKIVATNYLPNGERSDEVLLAITIAPGNDMSKDDRLLAHEIKKCLVLK